MRRTCEKVVRGGRVGQEFLTLGVFFGKKGWGGGGKGDSFELRTHCIVSCKSLTKHEKKKRKKAGRKQRVPSIRGRVTVGRGGGRRGRIGLLSTLLVRAVWNLVNYLTRPLLWMSSIMKKKKKNTIKKRKKMKLITDKPNLRPEAVMPGWLIGPPGVTTCQWCKQARLFMLYPVWRRG